MEKPENVSMFPNLVIIAIIILVMAFLLFVWMRKKIMIIQLREEEALMKIKSPIILRKRLHTQLSYNMFETSFTVIIYGILVLEDANKEIHKFVVTEYSHERLISLWKEAVPKTSGEQLLSGKS